MLVVNTVAIYSFHFAALWHVRMQISGDKTIQFLTQQYMFANVFVSLEGLRSAPTQCQKRKKVLRAQSFSCGICTAPQPWSMRMPITWLCLSHGNAVVDHVTNMEDKSSSREWPTVRKIVNGTAPGFSQKLATGLQSMVPALRDLQPYVFTREGGGGQVF